MSFATRTPRSTPRISQISSQLRPRLLQTQRRHATQDAKATLNTGDKIPLLGFGTWRDPEQYVITTLVDKQSSKAPNTASLERNAKLLKLTSRPPQSAKRSAACFESRISSHRRSTRLWHRASRRERHAGVRGAEERDFSGDEAVRDKKFPWRENNVDSSTGGTTHITQMMSRKLATLL